MTIFSPSAPAELSPCRLCPRACGADRSSSPGLCGATAELKIARAALHFWEEPCISGTSGSGAVFFSGCPLRCSFCQNRAVSRDGFGKTVSPERLVGICFELKAAGAQNLNLVTPLHYAPLLRETLLPVKKELGLPVVVNTGGYDSLRAVELFNGLADVWLPDYKFFSPLVARSLASAPDYPDVCRAALKAMFDQVGPPVFNENGALVRGMIVRHLVLPGFRRDSLSLLRSLRELFSPDQILLSLMSQYAPMPGAKPPLDRTLTSFEYQSVCDLASSLGFVGFTQDRSSASKDFIPPFDLTGV